MSMFSGKCDVYDTVVSIRADGDPSKIDYTKLHIYSYDNPLVELRIDCEKDLVPYYPYLQSYSSGYDGELHIHLSEQSFVDQEEQERLSWYLNDMLKYYKKCKRLKEEFTLSGFFASKGSSYWDKDIIVEIFNRVAKDGVKADITGLHDKAHDYYRNNLYEEMLRVGYTAFHATMWCWGLEEAFTRMRNVAESEK